jgi:membrane-associated progesterone receptor component
VCLCAPQRRLLTWPARRGVHDTAPRRGGGRGGLQCAGGRGGVPAGQVRRCDGGVTVVVSMGSHLGTPINTALFLYILYSVQRILFPKTAAPRPVPNEFKAGYSWMPKSHPPSVLFKVYTPKTLEPFNGQGGERILLAIDGTVYDVTSGRNFYGPGECTDARPTHTHIYVYTQRACMETLPEETPRGAWPSRALIPVSSDEAVRRRLAEQRHPAEVLTAVDQPLDKLDDLKPDEVYVVLSWCHKTHGLTVVQRQYERCVRRETECIHVCSSSLTQAGSSISPTSTSYAAGWSRTVRRELPFRLQFRLPLVLLLVHHSLWLHDPL